MAECPECSVEDLGGFSNDIFKLRYASSPEETWKEACLRVATAIGVAEQDDRKEEWTSKFKEVMENLYFIPAGRVIRNAGRKKGMLINCFVLGVDDSIESIGKLYNEALVVSATGGGIGVNFSNLRPEGDIIVGKGGHSSGAVSFIEALDSVAKTVESGGQRRAAFIGILSCSHPEIFKFIKAKIEEHRLPHFNISVGVTNTFIKAVKKDKLWELVFNNKIYKTIKAKELWDLIVHNAWTCGDPGIVNLDNIVTMNPTWYCETIESVNPCGEIVLPRYGSCCLGSINLDTMYDSVTNGVNWTRLKDTISIAVRFLDNVLDTTYFPVKEIELTSTSSRRIGLGVMGLHYLILKMGIKKYGSDESLEFMDELFSKIRDNAYLASIEVAKEKGVFQKFDMARYSEGMFVRSLPQRVKSKLRKYGIRNGAILSCPPTGTTSIVAGVSSGLEPIFAPVYARKYNAKKEEGKPRMAEKIVVDRLFKEFVQKGKDTSHFIGAYDIEPTDHMEVQSTLQPYVDNSISKTINMRKDFPENALSDLLLEYLPHIKGTTLYREGCKGNEILIPIDHTTISKEEMLKDETRA